MSQFILTRLSCVRVVALTAALAVPLATSAQNSARIYGVVTDSEGQPVGDATVTIEFSGGLARQYEVTTSAEGEFIQIGLMRGSYAVSAVKEEVGALTGTVTLRAGQVFEMNMELLTPGDVVRESLSEEDLAKLEAAEATTDAFNRGLAAARAGDLDEAVTLFTTAIEAAPDCAECQRNLGIVYTQQEDYAQAETAFKAALAANPDNAASYDGLAEIYNAQRRFDDAAAASAEAARLSGATDGGDSATAVFDQGLIFWNAGRLDEARQQFDRTLELDPEHGEAHYWLAMANLNGGQLPEAAAEFKIYLDREPNGRFAEQATGILSSIQP